MTDYYCDLAKDFADQTGVDSTGNEYYGPGGLQAAIEGWGAATALAAGDEIFIKGGQTDALQFTAANNDYALIESPMITKFPFTVSGRFNTSSAASQAVLWCGQKNQNDRSFIVTIYQGDIYLQFQNDAERNASYTATVDDGDDHHCVAVAYVVDTEVLVDIYLDGTFAETITNADWWPSIWTDITADRTAVGRRMGSSPSNPLDGNLWDWHVYDGLHATQADVTQLYLGNALANPTVI